MPLILQDKDSELAVLNGVLADQEVLDTIGLRPADFTDVKYSAAFQAMVTIHEAGRTLDLVSLAEQLRTTGKTDYAEVSRLSPVTAANVSYYAAKVREFSAKRQIVAILRGVKEGLEGLTSEELIDSLEQRLTDLVVGNTGAIQKLGDMLGPAISVLERRYQTKGEVPGLATGFPELDRVLTGLHPGNLIIIGARPSQGKTALALTMALTQSMAGKSVGFFSAEMTGEQLVMRALAGIGKINSQSVATGLLRESDFAKLMEAGRQLFQAPLYVDDTAYIPLGQLRSRARKMRRMGIECIYVDYLTLIRHGHEDPRIPRHVLVGEISKSLKLLSRELSIPIVALSQVGRDAENRLPTMADLRQSGEIEEDADVIIFIHRDKNTDDGGRDRLTLVDVAKNRHGATETVQLIFIPEYVRFESKANQRSPA